MVLLAEETEHSKGWWVGPGWGSTVKFRREAQIFVPAKVGRGGRGSMNRRQLLWWAVVGRPGGEKILSSGWVSRLSAGRSVGTAGWQRREVRARERGATVVGGTDGGEAVLRLGYFFFGSTEVALALSPGYTEDGEWGREACVMHG